jgi:hypothetical protein
MEYTVEMTSDSAIYVPSFMKISSVIQKMLGGGGDYTHKHTDRKVIS